MADADTPNPVVEAAVVAMYAVLIGLNVYLIADQITDGASSRRASEWWYGLRSRLAGAVEHRRARRQVVSEAMRVIIEDGAP